MSKLMPKQIIKIVFLFQFKMVFLSVFFSSLNQPELLSVKAYGNRDLFLAATNRFNMYNQRIFRMYVLTYMLLDEYKYDPPFPSSSTSVYRTDVCNTSLV